MRILHVTPTYLPATEWGGVVLTVAALLRGEHEQGSRVTVATTNARGAPGLPEHPVGEHRMEGIRTVFFAVRGSRRFAYGRGLSAYLRAAVREHDIVHIHGLWTYPSVAAGRACRSAAVPYVVTPHGMLLDWALAQKSWKKRLYRVLFQDRLLLGAAVLHCATGQEQREFPARYRRLPSIVIPNPIRIDDLLEIPPPEQGDDPMRLLIAGRIHAVKGFDHLVPALAGVRVRGVRVRLVVAGGDEGGYRADVERLAREHGVHEVLEFTGNLDRAALVREYGRATALVMPSYQESFGMSAAEAMAAGRPVIVSRGVSIASDIEAAEAGLVTDLGARAIGEAIVALARDPERRRALGINGRRFARQRYSPAAVASDMLAAYAASLGR